MSLAVSRQNSKTREEFEELEDKVSLVQGQNKLLTQV